MNLELCTVLSSMLESSKVLLHFSLVRVLPLCPACLHCELSSLFTL